MRADSHYVDQLESRYADRAIRLISTDKIEVLEQVSPGTVEALTKSILVHGVLQPLLVRRHSGRYRVIAGRRRLAAARSAGLSEVPCLVHDVDDAKAAELADADNLHEGRPGSDDARGVDQNAQLMRAASRELALFESSAVLLRSTSSSSFQRRVAVDLMQAQAWRAAWLVRAGAALAATPLDVERKSLAVVLDSVQAAFGPEARLRGLQLPVTVAPTVASLSIPGELGLVGLSGGIFAMLAGLDEIEQPTVEIHVGTPSPGLLKIEMVERTARVPSSEVVGPDASPGRGHPMAALGLRALKMLALESGGTVECTALGARGALVQATLSTH
jgi:hypothetical protein